MFSHRTSWVVGYPVLQEFFGVPGSHTISRLLHGPDSAAKRDRRGRAVSAGACLGVTQASSCLFYSSFDLLGYRLLSLYLP